MIDNKPIPPDRPLPPDAVNSQEMPEDDLPKVGKKNARLTKKLGIGFFAVILLYILGALLFSHDKSHDVAVEKTLAQDKIRPNYVSQKVENGTQTLPVSHEKEATVDPELQKMRLAYMEQQVKVYQIRQKSPISLWEDKQSAAPMPSMSQSTSGNLMNNSRLPLSNAQIDALKKAQSGDGNTAFQESSENSTVVRATANHIPYRDETVTQGTMISGVLQTAINSDLPGMIKANVSEDVYGSTGSQLLIPKGSTLIGQYNSGIGLGQQRVFVMWTRLIRPDGVDVMLGSPGTDSLGTSGLGADVLQTHFWERFGQASLLSIISAGIANAGVSSGEEYNSASQYRMMMSQNFQQSANSTLNATMNQKPTIYINQGDKIKVFVNRDLSFHEAQSQ